MSWKKVIVASDNGAVLPGDITTEGGHDTAGYYLGVTGNGTGVSWQLDDKYEHPLFTTTDIAIAVGSPTPLAGAHVINNLKVGVTTNSIGSVTATDQSSSTRELTLLDLGYTGNNNANLYTHPTYNGDDLSIDTGVMTGPEVIEQLQIDFETDDQGHVVDLSYVMSKRDLLLSDMNYTGSIKADAYTKWGLEIENNDGSSAGSYDMTSQSSLNLKAGTNCTFVPTYDSVNDHLELTLNAQADYVGHITSVSAGWGMDFTQLNAQNADGLISMGVPGTVSSQSLNSFLDASGDPETGSYTDAVSHTHLVTAYSDHSIENNKGHLVKSDIEGGVTFTNLEVTNSLVVSGTEIVLGSDNLTIEDNELQINWNTALNGGSGGYNATESAVILGHDDGTGNTAGGTKLINTVAALEITDIPASDASTAGGTTDAGAARAVKMGDLDCGDIASGNVVTAGGITASTHVHAGTYISLNGQTNAPTGQSNGDIYFDGTDLWIDL